MGRHLPYTWITRVLILSTPCGHLSEYGRNKKQIKSMLSMTMLKNYYPLFIGVILFLWLTLGELKQKVATSVWKQNTNTGSTTTIIQYNYNYTI